MIGKYLSLLTTLDISYSMVTDRGLRLLAGTPCTPSTRIQPSPSVVRSLSSLLENESLAFKQTSGDKLLTFATLRIQNQTTFACLRHMCGLQGMSVSELLGEREFECVCLKLEKLTMQSCDCVTEAGVRFVLENYKSIKTLVYHQRKSVFEILIKWCSELEVDKISSQSIKLEQLEHGFPYGISPFR